MLFVFLSKKKRVWSISARFWQRCVTMAACSLLRLCIKGFPVFVQLFPTGRQKWETWSLALRYCRRFSASSFWRLMDDYYEPCRHFYRTEMKYPAKSKESFE